MSEDRKDAIRAEVMAEMELGNDYSALSQPEKIRLGKEVNARLASDDKTPEQEAPVQEKSDDSVVRWYFKNCNHRLLWTDQETGERHKLVVPDHLWEGDLNNVNDAAVHAHLKSVSNGLHFREIGAVEGGIGDIADILRRAGSMSVDQLRAVLSAEEMSKAGLHSTEINRERLISAIILAKKQL